MASTIFSELVHNTSNLTFIKLIFLGKLVTGYRKVTKPVD